MSTQGSVYKSEPESNTWLDCVIMELAITVTDVIPNGCSEYCSESEETTTTKIRIPIWKLSPKTQGKFDENTGEYTGKYGEKLYTDIMAIKLLQKHEEILHTALYSNYKGVSQFETSRHAKGDRFKRVCIWCELTY